MATPRSGDVVYVTRAASVQFAVPILFRVISVDPRPTYEGWAWLCGYQIDASGDAVRRREIFIQVAGLLPPPLSPRPAHPCPRPRPFRHKSAAATQQRAGGP